MRRINRCLNVKVMEICQRVVQLEELNTHLHKYLPDPLREQCHVGSFTRGCLVLITNDSVWASQLRYSLPDLRDKLRSGAGLYQLVSIKVAVAMEKPAAPVKKQPISPLSATARDTIISQADQCSYLPLRQALHHLADHQPEPEETP